MSTTEQPWTPELIPIWQEAAEARWLVSTASDRDPTGENYWSGWTDVDANARTGVVELAGVEYTPAEARNLAEALRQAAEHAERFGQWMAGALFEVTCPGSWPEIDDQPLEVQYAARVALQAAAHRCRRQYSRAVDR